MRISISAAVASMFEAMAAKQAATRRHLIGPGQKTRLNRHGSKGGGKTYPFGKSKRARRAAALGKAA